MKTKLDFSLQNPNGTPDMNFSCFQLISTTIVSFIQFFSCFRTICSYLQLFYLPRYISIPKGYNIKGVEPHQCRSRREVRGKVRPLVFKKKKKNPLAHTMGIGSE